MIFWSFSDWLGFISYGVENFCFRSASGLISYFCCDCCCYSPARVCKIHCLDFYCRYQRVHVDLCCLFVSIQQYKMHLKIIHHSWFIPFEFQFQHNGWNVSFYFMTVWKWCAWCFVAFSYFVLLDVIHINEHRKHAYMHTNLCA